MTRTTMWMLAAATTATLLGATQASASDTPLDLSDCAHGGGGATSAQAVDYAALYGDPTWPSDAQRVAGISLQGPGQTDSALSQDPTFPATAVVAPAISLDTYVASKPDSSIDNEGPWRPVRAYSHLDTQIPCAAVAHR